MPRQYLTPAEFNETPVGLGYSNQGATSQLATNVLDKLSFRASQRADQLVGKRLGAPGSTTLAGNATSGSTVLSVASTLGYDNLAEQAIYLGTGATQEILLIQPGGVAVTSYASPYPGTITVSTPTSFAHSIGETITGVYREITEAGSASSSDPYSEAILSQAAQLARMHLPKATSALTRVVFTANYPIINILLVDHAYSFDNTWNVMDVPSLTIEPLLGWYRFQIGSIVLPQGLIRTTYTAGYQVIPDDVKEAVSLLMAEQISMIINPLMATEYRLGKRSYKFNFVKGRSALEQRAADILTPYVRYS